MLDTDKGFIIWNGETLVIYGTVTEQEVLHKIDWCRGKGQEFGCPYFPPIQLADGSTVIEDKHGVAQG